MDVKKVMSNLITELNNYTKAYDEGKPLISDKEWDDKYFTLVKLEEENNLRLPNSPTQSIDYQVVNKLEKVKHNHPMLSLSKSKDINVLKKFIGKERVFVMLKMDGLTCSLRYVNGRLVSAESRGNGEIGELITHNVKLLSSVPKSISFRDELIVDGEIICDYNNFELWKNEYANPRNMASGTIRLLDANESAKYNLTFVAWDVIKGFDEEKSLAKKLTDLQYYGFTCVDGFLYDNNKFNEFTFEETVERLKEIANKKAYPIDGVVVKYDDVDLYYSKGRNGHDFAGGKALKFYDEEYETKLKNIEWQVGRTSILSPVAVFDEVDLDGALTNKASLFNLDVIETYLNKPYIGQNIRVARMNMVIPKIVWGNKSAPEDAQFIELPTCCPACGSKVIIKSEEGYARNLYCSNPNCKGILLNKLDYFCGKFGLDIKGISASTLSFLIDQKWVRDYADLFNLTQFRQQWIKKNGYSITSVDKILNALEEAKTAELWRFISAIGIPMVGMNTAKEIAKHDKTWEDFYNHISNNFNFTTWDDFGPELNNAIYKYDYTVANELVKLFNLHNSLFIDCEKNRSLDGMTFCITGSLSHFVNREAMKEQIEKLGGKVTGSVSKKTTALINNDSESESSKNISAKKLSIPIITEEEFIKKYGVSAE